MALLQDLITTKDVRSVLLVGAESAQFDWSNIVETGLLASGAWVVVSGLGPDLALDAPKVFCDGRRLPFADESFDLVVSNAVVEHVGDEADQRAFIAEHHRVGRSFVVTTPNRWFPVESHRRVLLRHWSRAWRDAQAPLFTRLLSRQELHSLLPGGTRLRGHAWSPTFVATHDCATSDGCRR